MIYLVIFALIAERVWFAYQTSKERADLIKAIMAKDLTDYSNAKAAEQTQDFTPKEEFVESDQVSDDLFQRMIEKQT